MRKKIIFFTKFIPIPAHNGGAIRNAHWIKFLSQKYDIILIGLWSNNRGLENKEPFSNCEIIGEINKRSVFEIFKLLIGWIFKKESFILGQYYNKNLLSKVRDILKDNEIEFVFCSELSTMKYADLFISKKVPIYFDDQNVEYQLYGRMAEFINFPLNYFLKRESNLIKVFESKALELAEHIFSVSERDKEELICLTIDRNKITVIKNCFDDKKEKSSIPSKNPTIVFAGNLSWRPNKHGLKNFILEILPKVIASVPNVEVHIIGSNSSKSIEKISKGMRISFFIDVDEGKKEEIINNSWIGIVPLYFASGTRVKIVEYWSHGKVVVSTTIGAEGLEKSEGTMIAQSDSEFIEKLIYLLKNKVKINNLGEKNYLIFKDNYDYKSVYKESIFNFFN